MDLALLHELAAERRDRWDAEGIDWTVVDGPPTDKPAAWLVLGSGASLGQLTLWVSGEADLEWGGATTSGLRHYHLVSRDGLASCMTDLEAAVSSGWSNPTVDDLMQDLTSRAWVSDLWLHGSLATGDHVPGVSDIDIVAITGEPVGPGAVRDLERLHRRLDTTWPGSNLGCAYVDEARVADRTAVHPTWTHGRLVHRRLSAMVCAELLDHGRVLRGREPSAVLVPMTPDDVRDAVRQELIGYWSWAVRRPWLFLDSRLADLALLSMARARITLGTGELATKPDALVHVRAPDRVVAGLRRRRTGDARAVPVAPALAHHAWHDTRRTIAETARPACQGVAMDSSHSTEVDANADPLLQLAFMALDHAIDSVEASGGPLIPFVLTRTGDQMGLQRFVTGRLEEGVAVVEQHLTDFAAGTGDADGDGADGMCGAWDGYLTVEGRRTDAVFARAVDPAGSEVVLAQRYEVRGLVRKKATRSGNPALVEDSRRS